MSRIAATLQKWKSAGTPVVVPYITPEFPVAGSTIPMLLALEQAGAAMIEVGIPFSDPLADGPTIQHSSEVAIRNGASLTRVLELVREARTKTSIPIILMGYVNPLMRYGFDRFFADAAAAGADGLIIPDLPPEESEEYRAGCAKHGLSTVFLIAPTSTDERIRYIDSVSTGMSYCVSVTGVTGGQTAFGGGFDEFVARVRKNTQKPFVVGFGIDSREKVRHITATADGVVVGSALLRAVGNATTPDGAAADAAAFLKTLL